MYECSYKNLLSVLEACHKTLPSFKLIHFNTSYFHFYFEVKQVLLLSNVPAQSTQPFCLKVKVHLTNFSFSGQAEKGRGIW